jgi:transcription initiation factor TFIID subunit 12
MLISFQTLLDVADEFVDNVITSACQLAKIRGAQTLELRDIQLILERNYNIRVPGYASDELRTVRRIQPTQGWAQKMSAVQAAKVTGGKADM